MSDRSVPRYYGLRIYNSTTLLYTFLIIPFLIFLALQNVPQFIEKQNPLKAEGMVSDSLSGPNGLKGSTDSLQAILRSAQNLEKEDIDSFVQQAVKMGEQFTDSLTRKGIGSPVQVSVSDEGEQHNMFKENGAMSRFFKWLFFLTLLSYLAGLIYNIRFKRYFKLLRSNRSIPEQLHAFCKKELLRTPLVNSFILTLPSLVVILLSFFYFLPQGKFEGEVEKGLFIQFLYLTIVATLLEFLFVYYWQRHRVHIKYIEHIYSSEELRSKVFRRSGGKIRNRLLIASGMTTFLPLVVVLVYLILSLSSIRDLNLDTLSMEQKQILVGKWVTLFNPDQVNLSPEIYEKFYYVNAIDTLIMLVGIGTGILVSFIYILLFIKWTNRDITEPVKELLASMRATRTGEHEHYTIVRTNDEIGELAEGYNEMTEKIHHYVQSISKMNRDLEGKVKERTEEILMQKEEIEAQKEEIEAQLDLATRQRDTISRQKEQILDSIRYAERIQSAILPPLEHLAEMVTDYFILFRPRDIVSGDYYWTTVKGDKLLIAVADCTGHGVPGAFLSMLGIASLNEIVSRSDSFVPSQILGNFRDYLIHSLHQTGSKGETQDGIEVSLCVIDTRKRILRYAGANRSLYIVRNKKHNQADNPGKKKKQSGSLREENQNYQLIQIRGDRMPIGIYEQEPLPFTDQESTLVAGDTLYLFSDGYVDQLGGSNRKTFRSRRFRQLLIEIHEESMEDQKRILAQRLDQWRGAIEQIDDILVIGIKI
jgi:serine phosphatase RsbU (regulator of sigma subunit)